MPASIHQWIMIIRYTVHKYIITHALSMVYALTVVEVNLLPQNLNLMDIVMFGEHFIVSVCMPVSMSR